MELTIQQRPLDMASPTLSETVPASIGKYAVQYVWGVDSTTLQPVRLSQTVELGPVASGKL